MNLFTIKDLENLTGIKAHTIRIWEQRYSFLKPQRTETNIRYYSSNELKTILNIALLNKYGYKISHIDKMGETEMSEKIISLASSEAQQERVLNNLIQAMINLDIDAFEEIIDNYISRKSIDNAIVQIIFPFLERVGLLWLTNHINPAQEHLVTNIIRQKLIVGIEKIRISRTVNKVILLFLPEGEHHEIGLLFMQYLLKNKGITTLYMGAAVPLKDVVFVVKLKKPSFVYTHLTSVAHNFNFEKFLNNYHAQLPSTKLIVSGKLTQTYKKTIPANISFKTSLALVMDFIASFS